MVLKLFRKKILKIREKYIEEDSNSFKLSECFLLNEDIPSDDELKNTIYRYIIL